MATIDDLANAEQAEQMYEETVEQVREQRERQRDHAATREGLETAPEPVADGEGIDDDGEEFLGFRMTEERRVGATTMDVDGDPVRFAKPSGLASADMDDAIAEAQEQQLGTRETVEWLSNTLASWCLDDDRDAEDWARNHAMTDMVQLVRRLTLGGNGRARS